MNGKVLMVALVLGLATALPTKVKKTLRSHDNRASSGRLGIHDGTATTIDQHNYLVSILANDEFIGAGAIVSDSYVLTLGSLVEDYHPSRLVVVAGSSDGTTGTELPVETITVHPNYEDMTDSYNFALLMLNGTFTWGDDVGNVTLPSADPESGASLVASGWGETESSGSSSGTLLEGTMKYMTSRKCKSYYIDYDMDFDSSMACAYDKGGVTMCDGDFGNPMTDGDRVLYGLMADGGLDSFCKSDAIPIIISNVYAAVDWINSTVPTQTNSTQAA